jgi:hypothetical protein
MPSMLGRKNPNKKTEARSLQLPVSIYLSKSVLELLRVDLDVLLDPVSILGYSSCSRTDKGRNG